MGTRANGKNYRFFIVRFYAPPQMLVIATSVLHAIGGMWLPKAYAIAANRRFCAYGRILRSRLECRTHPLIYREQAC
jgi:hypothetical protein